jgi:hypothetical protein
MRSLEENKNNGGFIADLFGCLVGTTIQKIFIILVASTGPGNTFGKSMKVMATFILSKEQ